MSLLSWGCFLSKKILINIQSILFWKFFDWIDCFAGSLFQNTTPARENQEPWTKHNLWVQFCCVTGEHFLRWIVWWPSPLRCVAQAPLLWHGKARAPQGACATWKNNGKWQIVVCSSPKHPLGVCAWCVLAQSGGNMSILERERERENVLVRQGYVSTC